MKNDNFSAKIIERIIEDPPVKKIFPEIKLKNVEVQDKVNRLIKRKINRMSVEQGGRNENLLEMKSDYKITLNKNGIISMRFENLSFIEQQAHPSTVVRSLTADLEDATVYSIADFFKPGSGYRVDLRDIVNRQAKQREAPLISKVIISDDQAYYLTNNYLVLYFQEAEIAARVWGILEFPITIRFLRNVIDERGPLGRFVNS